MAEKSNVKVKGLGRLKRDVVRLNDVSRNLLDSATNSNTSKRDRDLNDFMDTIEDIIAADFKKMSIYSSEDLSKFLVDFLKSDAEKSGSGGFNLNQIEDVFENEGNGLLQQFQSKFQSEILLLDDLNMITSQFNELQEAIDITRDSILSADDQSNTVSRELVFQTKTDGSDGSSYVGTVEKLEGEHKLLKKIKSHIVPNTLKYGKYFVYVVPYEYVYSKYAKRANKAVSESAVTVLEGLTANEGNVAAVTESFTKEFAESVGVDYGKTPTRERSKMKDVLTEYMGAISIDNEDVTIPILENAGEIGQLMELNLNKQGKAAYKKGTPKVAADGVVDMEAGKMDTDFSNVNGCYIKLIDPRKMIPVRILEQTVGYYYIHEEPTTKNRSPFSSTFGNNLAQGMSKKEDDFIDQLSERIVKSFNKPFLEKNIKFKKSIASAIMHNEIHKKNIRFQFIPAEYVTEFKVNENENDEGTSILIGSLFYAKLYLALLLFNMITILSKSNDQRLYYVHSSGIDKNIANKVQKAARQIKSREINFSDMFNYKSMVSKVGAGRDAYIPVGTDDRRGISFDILAGQDVELYSELMTQLKTSAINSTGVPSVIMNYVNEADYAKSIVMGNLRFLARVMSLQIDFNDGLTDLYKKIMRFSGVLDEDVIEGFKLKLAKPRSLDATNMVELINNSDALAKFIVETIVGENSDMNEIDNKAKDLATRKVIKQLTSMLGWSNFEEIYDECVLEAKLILKEREQASEGSETE